MLVFSCRDRLTNNKEGNLIEAKISKPSILIARLYEANLLPILVIIPDD